MRPENLTKNQQENLITNNKIWQKKSEWKEASNCFLKSSKKSVKKIRKNKCVQKYTIKSPAYENPHRTILSVI